eukprot:g15350.t1
MRSVRNRSKTESETPAWLEKLVAASKNSVKGPIMTPIVSTERSIQMLELDHTPTAAAAAAEGIIHDVFPPYGGGTPENKYLGTAPATPAYHFYPGAGELAAVVPQQVDDRYPRVPQEPDDAKWFFDQDSCSSWEYLRDRGASLVSEFLAASAPRRSWKVIRSTVVPVLSAEEDPYLPPPGEEGVEELRKSMQEAKEKGAGAEPRKLFPDPVQLLTTPVGDWVPEEGRLNVQIGSLYRRQEMNDIANDSSSDHDVALCAGTSGRTTGAENDAREAANHGGAEDAQEQSGGVQPQGPRSRDGRRQQNAFGSLVPGDPTTSQESGYDIFMRHLNARVESRLSSTAGGMFAGAGGQTSRQPWKPGGPKPGGFYHLRQSRSVGPVSIAGALRELRAHEFPSYKEREMKMREELL